MSEKVDGIYTFWVEKTEKQPQNDLYVETEMICYVCKIEYPDQTEITFGHKKRPN